MKILIGCLSFNGFTGSELYVYELAKALSKHHEVHIVANISQDEMVNRVSEFGVKCHDLKTPPDFLLGDGVRQYKIHGQNKTMLKGKFYRISREHDFDLMILNQTSITSVLSDLYNTVSAIQIIHSEVLPRFEAPIKRGNINGYVAIRDSIKDHLVDEWGIDKNDIKVIWNPFDTERFNMNDVETDTGNYLFVGSYDYLRKNTIEELIKLAEKDEKKLILVGRGYPEFEQEWVETHEPCWDVEKYVKNCDAVASIKLGRTVFEGLLCGKPAFIYDIDEKGEIQSFTVEEPPRYINISEKICSDVVADKILEYANNKNK